MLCAVEESAIARADTASSLGGATRKLAPGVSRDREGRVVGAGEMVGISADTALRLGLVLGTSAEFWLNLQMRYDLLRATAALAERLETVRSLRAA